MGTIKTSIQLFDGATPGLLDIANALNRAVLGFEALERASSNCIDTNSLREGREELNMTKSSFQQIQDSIKAAGEQQKKFNKTISTGAEISEGIFSNQEKASGIVDSNSGADLSEMGQKALGSSNISSGVVGSGGNLSLGTGEEFPEEKAKQTKNDKVNAAVDTLSSVIPQGYTSTDEMKNSMFAAADEIDTKFSGLSQVLGSVWSGVTGEQVEAIKVTDLLANSWGSFAPVVTGAAAAMNLYNLAMDAGKVIQVLQAAATVIGAAFNKLWTTSVEEQTAAQAGLNSAILTCPITWIIASIIALIAIIFAVVAWINKTKETSISAVGIIAGAFAVLGAGIFNIIAFIWNIVAIFVNFLFNVFQDPIAAIKTLFYDLAINVIGFIRKIAEGIEALLNKIPGLEIDITSNLDGLLSELEKKSQDVKDKAGFEDVMQTLDYKDYSNAFNSGYYKGEQLQNTYGGIFSGSSAGDGGMDQLLQNTANTATNTGTMTDNMEISQEDIRYLRDISERDAINRFTTAQVSVDFKNEATINSDMDIDGVMNKFTDVLREAIFTQAEEVHAIV
ncbi:MAG: hypothetical protein VB047_06320 [Anaerotignum propionicum]|uniref:hypothetical protein n=1 Tax=Anaerotignum propionicum TaxID=28446 RepID=UPI002B21A3F5|nr:hypothetical protein [Anaerotignum propionicum]MEA5057156.1 hypothetical protein [Anaerotignum propionicum]